MIISKKNDSQKTAEPNDVAFPSLDAFAYTPKLNEGQAAALIASYLYIEKAALDRVAIDFPNEEPWPHVNAFMKSRLNNAFIPSIKGNIVDGKRTPNPARSAFYRFRMASTNNNRINLTKSAASEYLQNAENWDKLSRAVIDLASSMREATA